MIKFYDFGKTEDLTSGETADLIGLLEKADIPESFFDGVRFKWCPAFGLDVNGAFSILHPNTIYLTPSFKTAMTRLAATAAHELTHRLQFLTNPAAYLVISLPYIRNLAIEPAAEEAEVQVNDALGVDEAFRL